MQHCWRGEKRLILMESQKHHRKLQSRNFVRSLTLCSSSEGLSRLLVRTKRTIMIRWTGQGLKAEDRVGAAGPHGVGAEGVEGAEGGEAVLHHREFPCRVIQIVNLSGNDQTSQMTISTISLGQCWDLRGSTGRPVQTH